MREPVFPLPKPGEKVYDFSAELQAFKQRERARYEAEARRFLTWAATEHRCPIARGFLNEYLASCFTKASP